MTKKIDESKLLDVFSSDIPGAVLISMDSDNFEANIVPAVVGVKTYIGCIEFGRGDNNETYDYEGRDDEAMALYPTDCEKIYFGIPQAGTAWLVVPRPDKGDYVWHRVDHMLKFQNEEDWCDNHIEDLYEQRWNLCIDEYI